jgi:hypothetical protein
VESILKGTKPSNASFNDQCNRLYVADFVQSKIHLIDINFEVKDEIENLKIANPLDIVVASTTTQEQIEDTIYVVGEGEGNRHVSYIQLKIEGISPKPATEPANMVIRVEWPWYL